MTPLQLSTYEDDCRGPHIGDFIIEPGPEQQKYPTSADIARTTLQDASSLPEEMPEWNNITSSSLPPNEVAPWSALRGRLHLDSSPGMHQGTPSASSITPSSILSQHHGEGAHGSWALQSTTIQNPIEHARVYLFEDSMDISEAEVQRTTNHPSLVHHSASSNSMWEAERPCRPNPNSNHDMELFLTSWRIEYEFGNVLSPINEHVRSIRQVTRPPVVSRVHIEEKTFDIQGTRWSDFGTQASEAKAIRKRYHQHPHIRQFPDSAQARRLPEGQHVFDFEQMSTVAQPWIEHYQLRNLVTTTSFNDIHYVSRSKVMSFGPSTIQPICVMDVGESSSSYNAASDFHITALSAVGTTLIAGGFRGQYVVQDLLCEFGTAPTTGYISDHPLAITNHIHGTSSRATGQPMAVFCSNDHYLRALDINTNRVLTTVAYDDIMNCSATSPNGRLRVLVGDFDGALITDADSGRVLEHASGRAMGHGFSCAWADNDIHVATAGQDCQVLVWDARNWSSPLATIATENTYPTSLRFSPVGGGRPVLIVAEAADTVSVVNAQTYATKQTIEFFGDVAGTAISVDGSQLTIANGDRQLGGLMTFSRSHFDVGSGSGDGEHVDGNGGEAARRFASSQRSDWLPECELEFHPRVRIDAKARRRRDLRLHDMLF